MSSADDNNDMELWLDVPPKWVRRAKLSWQQTSCFGHLVLLLPFSSMEKAEQWKDSIFSSYLRYKLPLTPAGVQGTRNGKRVAVCQINYDL